MWLPQVCSQPQVSQRIHLRPHLPQPGDTTAVLAPLAPQPTVQRLNRACTGTFRATFCQSARSECSVAVFDTDSGNLLYERSGSESGNSGINKQIADFGGGVECLWRRLSDQDKRGADKFPRRTWCLSEVAILCCERHQRRRTSRLRHLTDLADQTANALKAAASSGGETPTTLSATVNFDDSLFTGLNRTELANLIRHLKTCVADYGADGQRRRWRRPPNGGEPSFRC